VSSTIQEVRFDRTGSPAVLFMENVPYVRPGRGQVRIRHEAVGINFIDTQVRAGIPALALPSGIGVEAAGVVIEVGQDVHMALGARVTYATSLQAARAYSTENIVAADAVMELPASISFETAAAMTVRGMGAGYVLRRLGPVTQGEIVVIHAAAGGLGLILVQWAKLLGLTVIGTVSTAPKARLARSFGCDHTILTDLEDVAARVRQIAGANGVRAVLGMACEVGNLPSVPTLTTILFSYGELTEFMQDRAHRDALAAELFGHVVAGRIHVQINQRYPLRQAAMAHRDLESRATTGSSVFII
jgi:NADPH2:quinone reductase